jgi:hypothetical protein
VPSRADFLDTRSTAPKGPNKSAWGRATRHEPRATPQVVNPQRRKALKGRNKRPASPVSPFQGWYVPDPAYPGRRSRVSPLHSAPGWHVPPRWGKEPPCARSFRMNQKERPHRPCTRTEIRWPRFEELAVRVPTVGRMVRRGFGARERAVRGHWPKSARHRSCLQPCSPSGAPPPPIVWLAKDSARNRSITPPEHRTQGVIPAKPSEEVVL